MIGLITLPLRILLLPVYDASTLLGDCFAISLSKNSHSNRIESTE
jgi:hypothetical protein